MNLIECLNIKNIQITISSFSADMSLGEFHKQPYGYLNGGVVIAFAEVLAGYASNKVLDTGKLAVGQTISANHIRKKSEGILIAKGVLLHKGKRNHIWDIKMIDEDNHLISHVTVVNAINEL